MWEVIGVLQNNMLELGPDLILSKLKRYLMKNSVKAFYLDGLNF